MYHRSLSVALAVVALCTGACSRAPSPDDLARLRKEYATYTLAANVEKGSLTLSSPDGSTSEVMVENLSRITLYRLNKADSTSGTARYFWLLEGRNTILQVPYFAVTPAQFSQELARVASHVHLLDLNRRTHEFEQNKFNVCNLWASPGTEPAKALKPYTDCER